jgi:hypothetical protein
MAVGRRPAEFRQPVPCHSRNAAMNSVPGVPEKAQNGVRITELGVSRVSEFLIVGWHHDWLVFVGYDERGFD